MNAFLPSSFGDLVGMVCAAICAYQFMATVSRVKAACEAHKRACDAFVNATKIGGAFGPPRGSR
jgi:hypothetical protein